MSDDVNIENVHIVRAVVTYISTKQRNPPVLKIFLKNETFYLYLLLTTTTYLFPEIDEIYCGVCMTSPHLACGF